MDEPAERLLLCGSKPYYNLDINKLIDNNFDTIFRCNMNLKYGSKLPKIQFLNCHVNSHYLKKSSITQWKTAYKNMCYENMIDKFYTYITSNNYTKFVYLPDNYTKEGKMFLHL